MPFFGSHGLCVPIRKSTKLELKMPSGIGSWEHVREHEIVRGAGVNLGGGILEASWYQPGFNLFGFPISRPPLLKGIGFPEKP